MSRSDLQSFSHEEICATAIKLWGKKRGEINREALDRMAKDYAGKPLHRNKAELKAELRSLIDLGFFR